MTQPVNTSFFSYITSFFTSSADTSAKVEKPFDPTAMIHPDSSESAEIAKALRKNATARVCPLTSIHPQTLTQEEQIAFQIFRAQVAHLSEPTVPSTETRPKPSRKIGEVYQPHVREGLAILREEGVRHDLEVLASPVGKNDFPLSGNSPSPFAQK